MFFGLVAHRHPLAKTSHADRCLVSNPVDASQVASTRAYTLACEDNNKNIARSCLCPSTYAMSAVRAVVRCPLMRASLAKASLVSFSLNGHITLFPRFRSSWP